MNQPINEMWEKAAVGTFPSGSNSWESQVSFVERFAQLVVGETITEMSRQLHWHGEDQSNNPAYYKAIEKTLRYFGIDERRSGR